MGSGILLMVCRINGISKFVPTLLFTQLTYTFSNCKSQQTHLRVAFMYSIKKVITSREKPLWS